MLRGTTAAINALLIWLSARICTSYRSPRQRDRIYWLAHRPGWICSTCVAICFSIWYFLLNFFLLLQLDQRLQQTVEQRPLLLRSRNELASPNGRQLFQFLNKYFGNNELNWKLDQIMVLQKVVVTPPYRTSDIRSLRKCPKLFKYVHSLVAKFYAQLPLGDRDDLPN